MRPVHWVIALVGALLVLHLAVIAFPSSSQEVMDEIYYVPAAQLMLNHTIVSPIVNGSNLEHPPLSKAFMAVGIALLGNDAYGWRVFSILFGLLCIPIMWLISRSLFATFLFSFDSMLFSISGLGLLDAPMLFFLMLGFALYFKQRYVLTGIALALSMLCKETAILGIAALVVYHLAYSDRKMEGFAYVLAPAFVVFLGGLQLYDSFFTTFPTALNHLAYILGYGSTLKGNSWCAYAAICTNGPYLNPLNWVTYYFPPELEVIRSGAITIGWRGISTLPVVWMGLVGLALGLKKKELRFPLFWFSFGYFPYIGLWLLGRVTYPYYLLPVIPALCVGASSLKLGSFTTLYRIALGLAVVMWFVSTYPLL